MTGKRNTFALLVEMESNMEVPQKAKNRTAIRPSSIYPKECAPENDRATCTPMFIVALFTIAKLWKQPTCSMHEWIKKMWYIYTVEFYSAIKKKEAGHWCLPPVILAIQEAEIRKIAVQSQPGQIVLRYLEKPFTKIGLVE
jgi:hypothetical protein